MALPEAEALEAIVVARLTEAAEALRRTAACAGTNDTVRAGVWSNAAGIVTAYLSYRAANDPSREPIEAIVGLAPSDDGVCFTVELCRPDGEILAAIARREIPADPPAALLSTVDTLAEGASREIVARLETLLFAEASRYRSRTA